MSEGKKDKINKEEDKIIPDAEITENQEMRTEEEAKKSEREMKIDNIFEAFKKKKANGNSLKDVEEDSFSIFLGKLSDEEINDLNRDKDSKSFTKKIKKLLAKKNAEEKVEPAKETEDKIPSSEAEDNNTEGDINPEPQAQEDDTNTSQQEEDKEENSQAKITEFAETSEEIEKLTGAKLSANYKKILNRIYENLKDENNSDRLNQWWYFEMKPNWWNLKELNKQQIIEINKFLIEYLKFSTNKSFQSEVALNNFFREIEEGLNKIVGKSEKTDEESKNENETSEKFKIGDKVYFQGEKSQTEGEIVKVIPRKNKSTLFKIAYTNSTNGKTITVTREEDSIVLSSEILGNRIAQLIKQMKEVPNGKLVDILMKDGKKHTGLIKEIIEDGEAVVKIRPKGLEVDYKFKVSEIDRFWQKNDSKPDSKTDRKPQEDEVDEIKPEELPEELRDLQKGDIISLKDSNKRVKGSFVKFYKSKNGDSIFMSIDERLGNSKLKSTYSLNIKNIDRIISINDKPFKKATEENSENSTNENKDEAETDSVKEAEKNAIIGRICFSISKLLRHETTKKGKTTQVKNENSEYILSLLRTENITIDEIEATGNVPDFFIKRLRKIENSPNTNNNTQEEKKPEEVAEPEQEGTQQEKEPGSEETKTEEESETEPKESEQEETQPEPEPESQPEETQPEPEETQQEEEAESEENEPEEAESEETEKEKEGEGEETDTPENVKKLKKTKEEFDTIISWFESNKKIVSSDDLKELDDLTHAFETMANLIQKNGSKDKDKLFEKLDSILEQIKDTFESYRVSFKGNDADELMLLTKLHIANAGKRKKSSPREMIKQAQMSQLEGVKSAYQSEIQKIISCIDASQTPEEIQKSLQEISKKTGINTEAIQKILDDQKAYIRMQSASGVGIKEAIKKALPKVAAYAGTAIGISIATAGFGTLAWLGFGGLGLLRFADQMRGNKKAEEELNAKYNEKIELMSHPKSELRTYIENSIAGEIALINRQKIQADYEKVLKTDNKKVSPAIAEFISQHLENENGKSEKIQLSLEALLKAEEKTTELEAAQAPKVSNSKTVSSLKRAWGIIFGGAENQSDRLINSALFTTVGLAARSWKPLRMILLGLGTSRLSGMAAEYYINKNKKEISEVHEKFVKAKPNEIAKNDELLTYGRYLLVTSKDKKGKAGEYLALKKKMEKALKLAIEKRISSAESAFAFVKESNDSLEEKEKDEKYISTSDKAKIAAAKVGGFFAGAALGWFISDLGQKNSEETLATEESPDIVPGEAPGAEKIAEIDSDDLAKGEIIDLEKQSISPDVEPGEVPGTEKIAKISDDIARGEAPGYSPNEHSQFFEEGRKIIDSPDIAPGEAPGIMPEEEVILDPVVPPTETVPHPPVISTETLREQLQAATIRKGEGIEHAFIRQLKENAQKFGYNPDSDGNIDKWAGSQAHKIAIDKGFVNPATGQEIRMEGGAIDKVAFKIDTDGAGNITVSEYTSDQLIKETAGTATIAEQLGDNKYLYGGKTVTEATREMPQPSENLVQATKEVITDAKSGARELSWLGEAQGEVLKKGLVESGYTYPIEKLAQIPVEDFSALEEAKIAVNQFTEMNKDFGNEFAFYYADLKTAPDGIPDAIVVTHNGEFFTNVLIDKTEEGRALMVAIEQARIPSESNLSQIILDADLNREQAIALINQTKYTGIEGFSLTEGVEQNSEFAKLMELFKGSERNLFLTPDGGLSNDQFTVFERYANILPRNKMEGILDLTRRIPWNLEQKIALADTLAYPGLDSSGVTEIVTKLIGQEATTDATKYVWDFKGNNPVLNIHKVFGNHRVIIDPFAPDRGIRIPQGILGIAPPKIFKINEMGEALKFFKK